MTITSVPTRRRALQAFGAIAVLPLFSLPLAQTAAGPAREFANTLWRPAGSSYHHVLGKATQQVQAS